MTIYSASSFGFANPRDGLSTCQACGAECGPKAYDCCDGEGHKRVEWHRQRAIFYDPVVGVYSWADAGDFETIESCRADIDDYLTGFEEPREPPEDTPALDPPWWETER